MAIHVTKQQNVFKNTYTHYCVESGIQLDIPVVMKQKPKIISIVGITASGKSALGIKLAQQFNGEIISCDSRQVYKGLDIGTAKVTKEEQAIVPHHLLDVCEPGKTFNVFDFQKLAYAAIEDILSRGKLPILVGGSGLYSRSIVEGYNFTSHKGHTVKHPVSAINNSANCNNSRCHPSILEGSHFNVGGDFLHEQKSKQNPLLERGVPSLGEGGVSDRSPCAPRYDVLQICLIPPREIIEPIVIKRNEERYAAGMIAETENLIAQGVSKEWLSSLGLDYFCNIKFIDGHYDLASYKQDHKNKTMQFIKRQRTWFRKEKNTTYLTNPSEFHEKSRELITKFLA